MQHQICHQVIMSSTHRFRVVLEKWKTTRVWRAWSRSYLVGSVLKKCTRDRRVREVLESLRQTFLKQRRTFMLAAASTIIKDPKHEDQHHALEEANITDEDLEKLLNDIEYVKDLSRKTLFCSTCGMRLMIDRKHEGISYCRCKHSHTESMDEWEPFMEADDVIIWRKEYKKGQGLYAYKVYGKYEDVKATDFSAVQLDGEYRRQWDDAVADLSVVQERVNGVLGQDIVHWEVLWPRMFANRDYVYIRRHKEFAVKSQLSSTRVNTVYNTNEMPIQSIDNNEECEQKKPQQDQGDCSKEDGQMNEVNGPRENVQSRARRKTWEDERRRIQDSVIDNKVYIISSRSCLHDAAPESKHAVRVTEYWSHMVVRTLNGDDQTGMEFVLTYYDEPCVGGLPCGVTAWATGRAAPAYLTRMRRAARCYRQEQQSATPVTTSTTHSEPSTLEPSSSPPPSPLAEDSQVTTPSLLAVESVAQPASEDLPPPEASTRMKDQSTQTEEPMPVTYDLATSTGDESKSSENSTDEDDAERNWWRYLYPFYYFI